MIIFHITVNTPLSERKTFAPPLLFGDHGEDKGDSEQDENGLSVSQMEGGMNAGGEKMKEEDDASSHQCGC